MKAGLKQLARDWNAAEPVMLAWALNGGLAVLLGTVSGISPAQEAAVTTIVTAAAGIFTVVRTKETAATSLTGTLATIAVAGGAFGLHLSSAQIGTGTAALGLVLALALRANVSPKS